MGLIAMAESAPALCATVGGVSAGELRAARDAASAGADMVEVRLDSMERPDAAAALAGRTRPVVVTCRPRWEGGAFDGSEEERLAVLRRAWELGAEHVDVEWRAPGARQFLEATGGARVVLSMHDFGGVPADLEAIVRDMAATPASVVKVAVTAHALADTLPIFALHRTLGARPFVGIAMGMAGLPTRILAATVGCCWTYAGAAWAPGQLPAGRLLDEFGFRRLRRDTAVYGVVGAPIGHSVSPAMHNAAFAAERIDAVYLPLQAASADDFLAFADGLAVRGASVTSPFKVALAARARGDDMAARVGAVNTLKREAGGWQATNTDVDGFLDPLRARLSLAGVRAAILGAGGAARAAAMALRDERAHVTIHARRPEQAALVARELGIAAGGALPEPGSWDVLVNATPVGTTPDVERSPMPPDRLDGRLVYDLVYNPPRTCLLRDAAAAGCETLGGLAMLVAQARRQFEWWTGRRPDAAVILAAAERRLAQTAEHPSRPHSQDRETGVGRSVRG
jgi:3-dehydroquinate dehydratase / shikimate dehydrogenase